MLPVNRILETCLYASDLAAAERFYVDVLGLEFVSRQVGRHVFLRCGQAMLLVFDPVVCSDRHGEFPPHGAQGPGHVAFAMRDQDLAAWRAYLNERGTAIEHQIDWPGGGRSLYFRDPAGNSVELASPRIWGMPESP